MQPCHQMIEHRGVNFWIEQSRGGMSFKARPNLSLPVVFDYFPGKCPLPRETALGTLMSLSQ